MPRFMGDNADRERVRDAADIVRLVGEHVALRPKGREYAGLCPFHEDHSPSMYVNPAKGIFKCFACGAGGDVFSFVQRFHKMEFREALEYLADRFGVALTPKRPREAGAPAESPTSELYEITGAAARFYQALLRDETHGRAGREVIARRGISAEMVERFQIGVAPDRWDGLVLRARQLGHPIRAYEEAGLVKRREDGSGHFDMLRHRLVFPIHDKAGRVVAFGGRRLNDEDEPKYLNTPESRIFRKGRVLYGLSHAGKAIQAAGHAIVTEGYMDTIALHQAGFECAVAALGTAFTPEHARELRLLTSSLVLLFDADEAGRRAADRAIGVLLGLPMDVRIATLSSATDAKDPDELLKREDGQEVFRRVLEQSPDVMAYLFQGLRAQLAGRGIAGTQLAIEQLGEVFSRNGWSSASPLRQALVVKRISEIAGVPGEAVRAVLGAGRSAPARAEDPDAGSPERRRILARLRSTGLGPGEHLMGCLLCEGELWLSLAPEDRALIAPESFDEPELRRLAELIDQVALRGDSPGVRSILDESEEPLVHDVATELHDRLSRETQDDRERLHEHWQACLARARLDRHGRGAASAWDGLEDALVELKRRRDRHAELGPDRRVLPNPSE